MKKFLFWVFGMLFLYALGMQVIVLVDQYHLWQSSQGTSGFHFVANFDPFSYFVSKQNQYIFYLVALTMLIFTLNLLFSTSFFESQKGGRSRSKSRYQKEAFNKLATTSEQKRGTYYVQYKSKGKPTPYNYRTLWVAITNAYRVMHNRLKARSRRPQIEFLRTIPNWSLKQSILTGFSTFKPYNSSLFLSHATGIIFILLVLKGMSLLPHFKIVQGFNWVTRTVLGLFSLVLLFVCLYAVLAAWTLKSKKGESAGSGIPVVVERRFLNKLGKFNKIWYLGGNVHTLVVGTTGRGKSVSFVIPMLFSYIHKGESFVAHDPKHELITYTIQALLDENYQVIVLDWTNPQDSEGWNPLTEAWNQYRDGFISFCESEHGKNEFLKFQKAKEKVVLKTDLTTQLSLLKDEIKSQLEKGEELTEEKKDMIFDSQPHLQEKEDELLTMIREIEKEIGTFNYQEMAQEFLEKVIASDHESSLTDQAAQTKGKISLAIEYTMDIANALAFDETAKDKHWGEGASDMIVGAALYLIEEAILDCTYHPEETDLNLRYRMPKAADIKFEKIYNFYHPLQSIDNMETLCDRLKRTKESESIQKMATFITALGNTRASYLATFQNSLKYITSTPSIRRMVATSTFDMESVFQKKTALFLLTHDEKATYYPLVSVFFKQLYEVAIRYTRQSGMSLKIPMNYVIDEMGMLPAINDIQNMYGAARSRNIRINGFIQSFEQLNLKYGRDVAKVIEDNSSNIVFLGSSTDETRKVFESKTGNRIEWNPSTHRYEEVPLLRKEQLNLLARGHSLILSIERYPYLARLPMVTEYSYWTKRLEKSMSPSITKMLVDEAKAQSIPRNEDVLEITKDVEKNKEKEEYLSSERLSSDEISEFDENSLIYELEQD